MLVVDSNNSTKWMALGCHVLISSYFRSVYFWSFSL